MDKKDKELLRRNNTELAEFISADITKVTRRLCSTGIITERMRDVVLQQSLDVDKAYHLLEQILPKRGPHAFEAFYICALEAGLFGAADILHPENAPHEQKPNFTYNSNVSAATESSDDSEPDPDVWPPATAPESVNVKVITVNDLKSSSKSKYKREYVKAKSPIGQESKYLMKHKCRGVALVINNKTFDNGPDRDGTDRDRQALDFMFRQMGFEFKVKSNQTMQEMKDLFLEQSKRDFSAFDCLVVVVLSHGEKGVVFGTDGKKGDDGKPENCIPISDITNRFCGVKSLISKPKLFFIQACQGKNKDPGVRLLSPGLGAGDGKNGTIHSNPSQGHNNSSGPAAADTSSGVSDSKDKVDSRLPTGDVGAQGNMSGQKFPTQQQACNEDIRLNEDPLDYLSEPQSDAPGPKKASVADVFVAMAAPPDFLTWRRPDFGTWFIQAVVEVFSKSAYRRSLLDMMQKVTRLVQKAETKRGSYKQVVKIKSTLDRALFFFPGLYEDMDDL